MPDLSRNLAAVADQSFDIAVIGGGITGAGIARQASQVGLRTVLVDAHDFAAGTSSRSTKLIHGGLRYLAMGDVALVRESALERKSVYTMAPHLAEPRWMLLPARSRWELMKFRAGLTTYEKLGAVAEQDKHRNWQGETLRRNEPTLDHVRFPFVCAYREYLTDDARLVLATLRAAAGAGAVVQNYLRVDGIDQTAQVCRLALTDTLADQTLSLMAKVVVNATGPWVETLLKSRPTKRLQLSKGVHLVVPHEKLPVGNIVMLTTDDKRTLFAIPRGRGTYVGTTDTPFDTGPTTWPDATRQDIDYLLAPLRKYFPRHPVGVSDVSATWAGLRPLIYQHGKSPREMSRKDEVWVDGNLISIAGGKLTGFRKMAEQVMDVVGDKIGRDVTMSTPLARLPGGSIESLGEVVNLLMKDYGLPRRQATRIARLYGGEAVRVLGGQPEALSESVYAQEVRWAMVMEGAQRLEDVIYRRLRAAWFVPDELEQLLPATATLMAAHMGWDDQHRRSELDACRAQLSQDLELTAS